RINDACRFSDRGRDMWETLPGSWHSNGKPPFLLRSRPRQIDMLPDLSVVKRLVSSHEVCLAGGYGARALGSTTARALPRAARRAARAGGPGRGAHAALPGADLPGRRAGVPRAARLSSRAPAGARRDLPFLPGRLSLSPGTGHRAGQDARAQPGLVVVRRLAGEHRRAVEPASADGARHAVARDADLRDTAAEAVLRRGRAGSAGHCGGAVLVAGGRAGGAARAARRPRVA